MASSRSTTRLPSSSRRVIRLGYVALVDCAPLAVAMEMGLFTKHGLHVRLSRELGWASVRDKIYRGELDAAQSISGIAFSLALGLSEPRRDVVVPMVLNLHGNAITLSRHLAHDLIEENGALKRKVEHGWKKDRPFMLAATHRHSSHHILLRQWLLRHGLADSSAVSIVFIPPPLMPAQLKAGHIDGFCVGEPWNSASILSGDGWCPATSATLSHGHPEKVLLLSDEFESEQRDETLRLVAALLEACKFCQDPAFRDDLIAILSRPEYTGASLEVLRNSLGPTFQTGTDTLPAHALHIFHGPDINTPSVDKASWTLSGLQAAGVLPKTTGLPLSRIYREDIFRNACKLTGAA